MGKFQSKQQAIELKRVKLNQLQNNLKQGLWKEEVYEKQFQVFEMGEYYNGQRIGKWICFQNNKQIAEGFYDDKGKKKGKWSELSNNLKNNQNVIYLGEYNMNNMKVGRWDIMYDRYGEGQYKYIGGGSYDQEGNQKKVGKWIELDEKFRQYYQITHIGEYNMNNIKVGRWDIMYCESYEMQYKQIGGGSYDQQGNQKKVGKWVELFDDFWDEAQVTYNGEYNMNNMKVGRWDIMQYDRRGKYKQMIFKFKYLSSGGGSYDQEGNQKKIGKWVELHENFADKKQVTYIGEYNLYNMKVGRWNVMNQLNVLFGCVNYDEDGNEIYRSQNETIIFVGSFKNCVKVGRWDIMYCQIGKKNYKQIIFNKNIHSGGGSYDQEGNQIKIGKWIELDEKFGQYYQITHVGEYNMNNNKVGRWDIMQCNRHGEYKQMQILQDLQEYLNLYSGGGSYDQEGNQNKIGRWVELFECFNQFAQITYSGEYNMYGMKVGRWDIMYCKDGGKEYKQIYLNTKIYSGDGFYDYEGNQKKIEKQVELDENFFIFQQVQKWIQREIEENQKMDMIIENKK